MSRKSRKMVRIWNKVVCPAIEYTVAIVGLLGAFVALPIFLILMFG